MAHSSARMILLLDRIALGDAEAFAALYDEAAPVLYGVALRLCGAPEPAATAFSEAWVKVWTTAGAFDASTMAPLPWLADLARTAAVDCLRRSDTIMAGAGATSGTAGEDALSQGRFNLHSVDDPRGELRRLSDAMSRLPAETRHMICLAYFNGLGLEALAVRFSRPLEQVRLLLARSLQILVRASHV